MLPAPDPAAASLAEVLRDRLDAVERGDVDRAAVLLVDGLGAENLLARRGHARTLAAALDDEAMLDTGVPTTTASALATLTTGTRPGAHGIVGYTSLVPRSGRVVNQLHGWDDGSLPPDWLRRPTLFAAARERGLAAHVVASDRYRDSGFTRAVLAGAAYHPARTIEARAGRLGELLADRSWRGIAYGYVAELDMAGHAEGAASSAWTDALEALEAAIAPVVAGLRRGTSIELTADHGMVDVPASGRLVVADGSPLWEGVAHLAGEHRLLHLHVEPGTTPETVARRWREAEGERAWVATRAEALAACWFGAVDADVVPRIGDVLVAARGPFAYYTEAAHAGNAGRMVGQHGSWTDAERLVPRLRFEA